MYHRTLHKEPETAYAFAGDLKGSHAPLGYLKTSFACDLGQWHKR
jgi:hypothetical protein